MRANFKIPQLIRLALGLALLIALLAIERTPTAAAADNRSMYLTWTSQRPLDKLHRTDKILVWQSLLYGQPATAPNAFKAAFCASLMPVTPVMSIPV